MVGQQGCETNKKPAQQNQLNKINSTKSTQQINSTNQLNKINSTKSNKPARNQFEEVKQWGKRNRTFFFTAFESLLRDESRSVVTLTDPSIFAPTAEQEKILEVLPPPQAQVLRLMLTAPPSTRELFEINNGVFPFTSRNFFNCKIRTHNCIIRFRC